MNEWLKFYRSTLVCLDGWCHETAQNFLNFHMFSASVEECNSLSGKTTKIYQKYMVDGGGMVAWEYHTVLLTKGISAELNYISFSFFYRNSQKNHNRNGLREVLASVCQLLWHTRFQQVTGGLWFLVGQLRLLCSPFLESIYFRRSINNYERQPEIPILTNRQNAFILSRNVWIAGVFQKMV